MRTGRLLQRSSQYVAHGVAPAHVKSRQRPAAVRSNANGNIAVAKVNATVATRQSESQSALLGQTTETACSTFSKVTVMSSGVCAAEIEICLVAMGMKKTPKSISVRLN